MTPPPGAFERERDKIQTLFQSGKYAAVDSAGRQLLAWADSVRGPQSLESAQALDLVVAGLRESGKGTEAGALGLAERAVQLRERLHGPDHAETAASLYSLGYILLQNGKYESAREPLNRSLAAGRSAPQPDDRAVAMTLNALGILEERVGNLEQAKLRYGESLAIRVRSLPPDDPDVASSLNNVAGVLTNLAEYDSAQVLYERAIDIRVRSLGPDHPAVARALSNLGRLHYLRDDLSSAREALGRSLAIHEKLGESREMAFALYILGQVLRDEGDLDGARLQLDRSLAIRRRLLGKDHPMVATGMTSLADVLIEPGDTREAAVLLEGALGVLERNGSADQPNMAEALHSLANLRRDTGDPAGARALYQRSLAIWSKRFGPEHPIYALGLRDLAVLDLDERRTGTAVGELASVLAIQDSLLGPEHSEVGITLEAYSRALLAAGDSSRAIAAALRCERIGRDYARLTGRALSERQALRSADVRSRGLPVAVAALSRTLPDSVYRSVLDGVIHSRALVLDEMAERRRTLSAMGDSTVDALKTRLRDASRGVAKLLVEGPDQDHPETYRRSIQEAQERLGAAERDLAARSDAFRRLRRGRSIGVDEVESALPRGAALVAFVRSERHERLERPAGDAEYSAFVLSARGTPIAHVRLGSAHRVDALVATWRREAAEGAVRGTGGSDPDSAYRVAGVPLRRCIWDPVARLCRNAGRIFVVPDGALHLVSFAALPTGRRGYVIESGPVIHYLSAERDLVPDPEGAGSRSRRLLAMGGPAFDDRPHAAAPGASYRGTRSSCAEFRSVRFAALPASRAEVRDITARWRRFEPALASAGQGQVATTPTSVELTGTAASEAAFKAEAPRAEVVHLATHGFFIGQSCARASVGARGIGGYGAEAIRRPPREHAEKGSADHQASDSAENPLALSGLALASANNRDSAGPEDEDGILTAEEIAAMDLSGTALVVLSACDTGSGELRAGEGVMGLRRAFHIAGAGSLIMSLWQVEDRSARAWMNSFYESRLRRGGSIDEAVRAAGLELLRSRRASHRSTHPFYWGGFVAEGDWH